MNFLMERAKSVAVIVLTASIFTTSCKKNDYHGGKDDDDKNPPQVQANVFSAASDSAGIVSKLDEFRNALGSTLNTAPGAVGGRREVNWDAVPANLTNINGFPSDFFGQSDPALPNGRKRGLLMTNTGTSFRVDTTDFSEIDAFS